MRNRFIPIKQFSTTLASVDGVNFSPIRRAFFAATIIDIILILKRNVLMNSTDEQEYRKHV